MSNTEILMNSAKARAVMASALLELKNMLTKRFRKIFYRCQNNYHDINF